MFKKNMFKIISLGLVVGSGLVGCGTDDDIESDSNEAASTEEVSTDKEFSLTVWTHPFVDASLRSEQDIVFESMVDDYLEEFPNADVTVEEIPWQNREQKLMTALSAGEGPDIFYMIPDMMTQFANQGVLAPIEEHLSDDFSEEDFFDTSIEAVTFDDSMFGIPLLREVQTMIYNTDILEEIGTDVNNLPETWEEFDALAADAKEAGYYARNFQAGDIMNATLYPYIWQAGGDILDGDEVVIDSPEAISAFEEVKSQYDHGYLPENSITDVDDYIGSFIDGEMMSSFSTGVLISTLQDAGKDNFIIGPPLAEKEQATFGVTGMFSVAEGSKNKAEAVRLVETMTETDNMAEFNKITKYIPARNSALYIYEDDAVMNEFIKYVDVARPGVIHPSARIFQPMFQSNVQAMLEGVLTPEEAAKQSADMIKNEIE